MSEHEIKSELEKLTVLIKQAKIILTKNRKGIKDVKNAITKLRRALESEEDLDKLQELLDINCLLIRKDEADVENLRALVKCYSETIDKARTLDIDINSNEVEIEMNMFIGLTINNVYELNNENPFIGHNGFLKQLKTYYEEVEEYEKCAFIRDKIEENTRRAS